MTNRMLMSIVLPVLNEGRYLEETLAAIKDQDADPESFEVLLYDGGSTDDTMEIARRWAKDFRHFSISDNPGRLPAFARNRGIAEAKGEVISFVEGHCVLPSAFVRRSLELLSTRAVEALGRPIRLVVPGDPPVQKAIGLARESFLGHSPSSYLYGRFEGVVSAASCATIYRRDVLEKLGGFDETFYVGEDLDLNQRFDEAGWAHYFAQELACYYHPRRTLRALLHQMFSYGLGRLRFFRKRKGRVSPIDLLPLCMVGGVAASTASAFLLGAWPLSIPAASYFLVVILGGAAEAARRGHAFLSPIVVAAILVTHLGLALGQLGGLLEWLMPRRPRRPAAR